MTATTSPHLYVVTTGLPGPGIDAVLSDMVRRHPEDEPKINDVRRALKEEPPCEFVELEDADGKSHGPSSGVDWSDHPAEHPANPPLHRLGPFVAAKDYEALREAAATYFREFDHLIKGQYPERTALRELVGGGDDG